jgi:hypothetical protein
MHIVVRTMSPPFFFLRIENFVEISHDHQRQVELTI